MPFSLFLIVLAILDSPCLVDAICPVFATLFKWPSPPCVFHMPFESRPTALEFCTRCFDWTKKIPGSKIYFSHLLVEISHWEMDFA